MAADLSTSGIESIADSVASVLIVQKRARKLAEEDAVKLYNRIRQLQKEEEKAQKRIQETRRKVSDIHQVRQRNEAKNADKEARARETVAEIERLKQEHARLKEQHIRARQDVEARLLADKANLAAQTKEERAEIEAAIAELRQERQKQVAQKRDTVKKQLSQGGTKLQQQRAARLQMAQEEYERRVREEAEAKEQKEQEIAELARLEMELIERLKKKQAEQNKAYQQLEAALALSSTGTRSVSRNNQSSPSHQTTASRPTSGAQHSSSDPSDEDIARAFAAYDVDARGVISTAQITGLMRDLKMPLNKQQLHIALSQLDQTKSGQVSFGHFLLWWKG
eukprot:jgi/Chrzof1/1940/Cz10g27070.t1